MPWHQKAMKEVEGYQKLRGAANRALIRRFLNGEIRYGKTVSSAFEYIGCGGKRPELKHLSRARKRKRS